MEDSEIIISGPEFTGPEYLGSLAEFLVPKMKAQPKDFIVQVDCATNESITSYDFLEQSLEVAEGLIEFGLKPEDLVIHAGSNSIRSHVVAMGIILSGGVLSPIDQNLRSFELQHFFKEFKPKIIICERQAADEIQSSAKAVDKDIKIILMDAAAPVGEFYCWEDIRTKVDVHNYVPRGIRDPKKCPCTVNCSSGSTGMPKGVALSHYNILASYASIESLGIPEVNQNFLFASPLFWISGTMLLLNSAYFGQARYIPKSLEPEDILEGIEKCQPSFVIMAPPSILALVRVKNFEKYNLGSFRSIMSAGGPLGQSIVNEVKEVWPYFTITNFYGLTEATGGVAAAFGLDDPTAIGKLLIGFKAKVVDVNTGKSLGPNQTGEIRVKSNRLMIGYYNNKEATKEAFDENGWLRTKDLVYYDENHVFHFVGRMQEVIQYLNYKIPPAELEAFIIGLPGVKDVAIAGVPHEIDANHLRALVVKDPNFDITAEEIMQRVKESFTDRKQLRAGVQFVDALPRTTVGKLRRVEVQKLIQMTK